MKPDLKWKYKNNPSGVLKWVQILIRTRIQFYMFFFFWSLHVMWCYGTDRHWWYPRLHEHESSTYEKSNYMPKKSSRDCQEKRKMIIRYSVCRRFGWLCTSFSRQFPSGINDLHVFDIWSRKGWAFIRLQRTLSLISTLPLIFESIVYTHNYSNSSLGWRQPLASYLRECEERDKWRGGCSGNGGGWQPMGIVAIEIQ